MQTGNSVLVMKAILWTGFAVLANYMITFLLTPYITENIGAEAFGFVSLGRTLASYATIITIALNSFAARYISVAYHKGDFKKANQYYTSVFYADVVLGGLLLLIASIVILYLQHLLDIPKELITDVKWLFFFIFLNFGIVSSATSFSVAPIIKNRMDINGKIKCLSLCLEAAFLILIFSFRMPRVSYVGLGAIVAASSIIVVYYILTKRMTPELKIHKKDYSFGAVKELVVNGVWNSINSLGNTLNTGLDLLITNMMLSALQMGQLAIVKTINMIFYTLYATLAGPFQPLLLKAYAEENKEGQIQIFKQVMKLSGMFSNIVFAGFLTFGMVYYRLWTPSQDISLLQGITIVTVLGGVIEGVVYPLYFTYTLTLKNKIPCFITILSGVLNVLGMVVLIKVFQIGIYSVVTTTTVLTWLVNLVFNPQYAAHCLGIKKTTFYPILLRHFLSCVLMVAVFKGVAFFVTPTSWLQLIGTAVLCGILGVIVHGAVIMDKRDYASMKNKIGSLKQKIKNILPK